MPAAWLLWDALHDQLGANPIEKITRRTGHWTLVFILITLAVSPARRWLRWNDLIQYRRMLGLFAFFYGTLHFLTYFVLDQFFSLPDIADDILKRPYITVGFTAFILLIPLAVTSTRKSIKRMGGRRWNRLHALIYVTGALATLHFLWLTKGDSLRPVWYALVLVGLLLLRVPAMARWGRGTPRATAPSPAPPAPAGSAPAQR